MAWYEKYADAFTGTYGSLDSVWVVVGTLYNPYYHGLRDGNGNYISSSIWTASFDYYNASLGDNQYSETLPTANIYARTFCRVQSGVSPNLYQGMWFPESGGHVNLYKIVNGSQTEIGSGAALSAIANTLFRIRAEGTNLTLSSDGTDCLGPSSDSTFNGGYTGLGADGTNINPDPLVSSWSAGDDQAPPTSFLYGIMSHKFIPPLLGGR